MAKKFNNGSKNLVSKAPSKPPATKVVQKITYLLNDPTSPSLTSSINVTDVATPLFRIDGYTGPNTNFTTNAGLASNCQAILGFNLLQVYNKFADSKITKWAAAPYLSVLPLAGKMANAFYDRRSLQFFYFVANKANIYTASSADIVSHELGHAVLDFLRPDFWNTVSVEIFAFHEGFGDIFAFLCSIHHDEIINYILSETKGNLFETNLASKIGEQFGMSLGLGGYLRNVDNDLSYVNPVNLPSYSDNPETLTKEPHNFSRVISGAVYRIFAEIYNGEGKDKQAFIAARDFTRNIFLKASQQTPATSNFFIGFSKILYNIALATNQKYATYVYNVLNARKLLQMSMNIDACVDNTCRMMINEYDYENFVIRNYDHIVSVDDIIKTDKHKCLEGVKIRIPSDDIEFKNNSFGFGPHISDMTSSVQCATDALNLIIDKNMLGTVWTVNEEGVLERQYVRCDGFVNNCTIPGQPEYNKCWKYRISGCGCGGPYGCPPEQKKIETPVKNFCGANYTIKCANTRTSACQVR